MAAGTRRIQASLTAGSVNENVLSGTAIEFPGRASQVEIYATFPAGVAGDILMDVQFGTDLVGEAIVVPVETLANQGPLIPDHLILVDALAPADRLIVRLRNTSAGTLVVTVLVRVQPV